MFVISCVVLFSQYCLVLFVLHKSVQYVPQVWSKTRVLARYYYEKAKYLATRLIGPAAKPQEGGGRKRRPMRRMMRKRPSVLVTMADHAIKKNRTCTTSQDAISQVPSLPGEPCPKSALL